jgi:arylsulfatase A
MIPAGQTTDDLVDFSDFYATFVELAGSPPTDGPAIDGQSFARRVLGKGPGLRSWALAQSGNRHWVRTQRWKLYNDGQLFDVQADPSEKQSFTGEPPADALKRLKAALQQL